MHVLLQGYILRLFLQKPQHMPELPGCRSGSWTWQAEVGQQFILTILKTLNDAFCAAWASRLSLHILWKSSGYLRNLLKIKSPVLDLNHRFWRPTKPLPWTRGFKGRVRLARNTLTNALMVLPYLTFQSCIKTLTHTHRLRILTLNSLDTCMSAHLVAQLA